VYLTGYSQYLEPVWSREESPVTKTGHVTISGRLSAGHSPVTAMREYHYTGSGAGIWAGDPVPGGTGPG
jgi:hypothetical protein